MMRAARTHGNGGQDGETIVRTRGFLLLGAALAAYPSGAVAQTDRTAALEARLAELERVVGELRGELATARAAGTAAAPPAATATTQTAAATGTPAGGTATTPATTGAAPAEGFNVAGTTVKFNGFIKANAIFSRYDDGTIASNTLGRDFYLPSAIPVGGLKESDDFDGHAKQTRLWLTTATPISGRMLRGHVEFDFQTTFGAGSERTTNGYNLALRRGFITFDDLLVGQEWTNFQNMAALPETTDFIGPTEGTVFVRQMQLRYTVPLGGGLSVSASVENPETASIVPSSAALIENDDDRIPDFTARVNYAGAFGELSLAGLVRQLSVDEGALDGDATGWGVSAAGKLLFGPTKQHDVRFMVTAGHGIGRYLGLNFAPDAIFLAGNGGRLYTVDNFATFGAVRLAWTPKWRSTFMGSYQDTNYPETITPLASNALAWSAAANLFYSPVKGLDFGFEYRHGERELVSDADGQLDRTEFIAKYSF